MRTKDTRSGSLDPLRERALVIAAQASRRAWESAPHRRWRCAAWDELFLRHERTIWKQVRLFASKAARHGIDREELFAEFSVAFFRTVAQFDYARSNRIATPFAWEVKRQYLDAVYRINPRGLRLPHHVIELLAQIVRAERRHRAHHGKEPTDDQVAASANLPIEQVARWRAWQGNYLSLDAPTYRDSDVTLHDVLADRRAEDPSAIDDGHEFDMAFSTLPPRDQIALTARYLEEEERTLQEVGVRMGVSGERVRVLVNRARKRLRRAILFQRHPGSPGAVDGRAAMDPKHA